jgi:hypothetical protein
VLNNQEIVVVANTSTQSSFAGSVIVDSNLNPVGSQLQVLFANKGPCSRPGRRPVHRSS